MVRTSGSEGRVVALGEPAAVVDAEAVVAVVVDGEELVVPAGVPVVVSEGSESTHEPGV
jgi:hypothetical protein